MSETQILRTSTLILRELTNYIASPEIPRILWNPKVYYRVHESPSGPYSELDASNPNIPTVFP